jgi:hypothetical protein
MATPPDFTAGQVLTAAQMNKIGLWVVKTETAFSAAASVTADSVFTADFTNYVLKLRYTTSTTGSVSLAPALTTTFSQSTATAHRSPRQAPPHKPAQTSAS